MESKKFFGRLRYLKKNEFFVLGIYKFYYNDIYYVHNLSSGELEFSHKNVKEIYKTFIDLLVILGLVEKEEE